MHADEHIHTVPAVDLKIRHARHVRLAVHIHAEHRAVLQPNAVHNERRTVGVIDQQLSGRRTFRREDRVKRQRVLRERQT